MPSPFGVHDSIQGATPSWASKRWSYWPPRPNHLYFNIYITIQQWVVFINFTKASNRHIRIISNPSYTNSLVAEKQTTQQEQKIQIWIKKSRLIPLLIVALNALSIMLRWHHLPEQLPAHYDIQGNAGGTMPRSALLLYILVGVVVCLITYTIGHMKQKLQKGVVILASGVCLVLFSSTMVTLTSGTMPIFMLAEPIILLAAIVGFTISVVRSYKRNK